MVFRTRRIVKKYAKKQRKQRKFFDKCALNSKYRNFGVFNRILEFKIKSSKTSFNPEIEFNNPFITKDNELNFFKHSRIPFTSFAAANRKLSSNLQDQRKKKNNFNLDRIQDTITFHLPDDNLISVLKLFSEFELKTILVSNLGSSLISYDIPFLSSFFSFFATYMNQIAEDQLDNIIFFDDCRVPGIVADFILLSFEWIQFISSLWLNLEINDFFIDLLDMKDEIARFDLEVTKIEPEDRASEEDLIDHRLEVLKDYTLDSDLKTNLLPAIENAFIFTNFFFPVHNVVEDLDTLQGIIDNVFSFTFLFTKN